MANVGYLDGHVEPRTEEFVASPSQLGPAANTLRQQMKLGYISAQQRRCVSSRVTKPCRFPFCLVGRRQGQRLALHALLQQPEEWEVVALLTSVSDEYQRISHHGVREELLDRQAEAIGLPLDKLRLPFKDGPCTNADYEALVGEKLAGYVERGVIARRPRRYFPGGPAGLS